MLKKLFPIYSTMTKGGFRGPDDWDTKFGAWKEKKNPSVSSKPVISQAPFYSNPPSLITRKVVAIKHVIEEKLNLDHHRKLKFFLTVVAYLIPLLVLAGILLFIFKPVIAQDNYSYYTDVGVKGDDSTSKPLYLAKSKSLSPPVLYGNQTYREIVKTLPFEINFKSPVIIPKDSEVSLYLNVLGGNSTLYINGELALPNLQNYELFKEFSDSHLFKRKDIKESSSYEKEDVSEFLIENFRGANVYSFLPLSFNDAVNDFKKEETYINNSFRGDLTFLIYTENGFKLNFKKQDMNWYQGEDNYSIIIKDSEDYVVYEDFIGDDGEENGTRLAGVEQEFNISVLDINGFYYVTFNGGKNTDSIIKQISFDTNKLAFYKGFLVLDPISIYLTNYFQRNLIFYYWHSEASQNININNEIVYLGKSYDGIPYNYKLEYGEYNIAVEKGDISIKDDSLLYPSKENYFAMPLLLQSTFDNPDFVVLDKSKFSLNENGFALNHPLPNQQEQKILVKVGSKNNLKLKQIGMEIL